MGYGKKWKVPKSTLKDLINNADSEGNCSIEIWNSSVNVIEDTGTELWLKLADAWSDYIITDPPPVDPAI